MTVIKEGYACVKFSREAQGRACRSAIGFGGPPRIDFVRFAGCTIASEKFKFWPTPGEGTWQSLLFWGLFAALT